MRRILALAAIFCAFALPANAVPSAWTTFDNCSTTTVKTVAITSGTSYTIPGDYCSTVEVDAIGEGSAGTTTHGGGAGAWSQITTGVYAVGQAIAIQIGAGSSSTKTCWVSCATLAADFGLNTGAGGLSANSVGTTKFSGGGGGSAGQGGGGAAGASGSGQPVFSAVGGNGDAGAGGLGGGSQTQGSAGAEYTATLGGTFGSGGGGGGSSTATPAGAGGLYGAGGGSGTTTPGAGSGGLIIFKYNAGH